MPDTLHESSVLVLTKDGENALHEAGTKLGPRHLQVLVLIDGNAPRWRISTAAAGTSLATLEHAEIVTEDGKQWYRYVRALPVQELCTQCHGTPDKLSPAVQEKLKALYPDDKAVGYEPGDIRGTMTIRKAL